MTIANEHPVRTRIRREAARWQRSSSASDLDELDEFELSLQANVLLAAVEEDSLIEVPASLVSTAIDKALTERDWDAAAGAAYEPPFASTLLAPARPVLEDYLLDERIYAIHLYRAVHMHVNPDDPEDDQVAEERHITLLSNGGVYEMMWFDDGSYDPELFPEHIPELCEFLRRLAVTLTEALRGPGITFEAGATRGPQGQVDYVARLKRP